MAPSRSSRSSATTTNIPTTPLIPTTRSRKTSTLAPVENTQTTTSRLSKLPFLKSSNSVAATPNRNNTTPSVKPTWGAASKPEPIPSRLSKVVVNNNNNNNNNIKRDAGPRTVSPPMTPGSNGLGIQLDGTVEIKLNETGLEDFLKGTTVDFGGEKYEPSREPIKAYLRVRPSANGNSRNYIQTINDSEVLMVPPEDHRLNPASISSSFFSGPLLRRNLPTASRDASPIGTVYKFTKVFSPSQLNSEAPSVTDTQSSFFKETTLPLVHDFLGGQNCLLFAYGPTGSGKTWTVQGGEGENAGLLPRVMDVIWRSLQGKESKSNLRPTMVSGVEVGPTPHRVAQFGGPMSSTPSKSASFSQSNLGVGSNLSDDMFKKALEQSGMPDIVPVDDAYEYSIWVSYAEIYNEKVYDLLESPLPTTTVSSSSSTHSATSVFRAGLGFLSVAAKAKGFMKGLSTVKRNALPLKLDSGAGNKYVHGMKEIRVHSAEEARSLLDRGQSNRRVFSTLSNRVSSRSHSVFTIKIIRILKGANPEDPSSARSSRFSIVDLAGSERVGNTQTTGDRLKEAANINKSLMVLGQCMEVLRKNQERGRKPGLVPFGHSKLTELFQSFFVGDGKAVMIVNVNPYDTGFDENSHVMKFSAVAKGLLTVKAPSRAPNPIVVVPVTPVAKPVRIVRMSMIAGGEEEDIIYEEEDAESDFDEDEQDDEFVNALLEELTALRTALYESQIEKIMAESEVRTRTVKEYEQKLVDMEKRYQEKMRDEADHAQTKLNAKLDILTRLYESRAAAAAATPTTPTTPSNYDDSDEQDESDEEEDEDEEDDEQEESRETDDASADIEAMLLDDGNGDRSMAAEDSPLARAHGRISSGEILTPIRTLANIIAAHNVEDESYSEGEATERKTSICEEDDIESEEEEDDSIDLAAGGSSFEVESDEYEEDEEDELSEDEYVPAPRASTARAPRGSLASSKQDVIVNKKKVTPVKKIVESINVDLVVEIQAKVRKGTPVRTLKAVKEDSENTPISESKEDVIEEHEEEEEVLSKPISASKKKPKRKLGGLKIKDVEELDSIAEALAVAPMVKSTSNRSLASSIRSSYGSSPFMTR